MSSRGWSAGRRAAALAIGAAALLAGVAAAAPQAVGVALSPSVVQTDIDTRSFRTDMTLSNYDAVARDVTLTVAGLGHDLDGVWQFLEPADPAAETKLSFDRAEMEPGERRPLEVTSKLPPGKPALYTAVLATYTEEQEGASSVLVRARVATLFLVRGPKPWLERIRVEDVGIVPAREKGRPATVHAVIRNTGNVHVRPTGRVEIRKDGKLLDTVKLSGDKLVLPGFARRIAGEWTPPDGLTGRVDLEAILANPSARGRGTADLRDGAVRIDSAKISDLRAGIDGTPVVRLTLTNTGTTTIAPHVVLFAKDGAAERARTILPQSAMSPGEARRLEWRPKLDPGVYQVTVQAMLGDRLLDETVVGLAVPDGAAAGGGSGWIWIVLAVLALGVLAFLFRRRLLVLLRRRRDAEDADEPSAPEGEPVATEHAPADEPVLVSSVRAGRSDQGGRRTRQAARPRTSRSSATRSGRARAGSRGRAPAGSKRGGKAPARGRSR